MSTREPLHLLYRPRKLQNVLGQHDVVESLLAMLNNKDQPRPHCFLLAGPSGVGKTTIARILAFEFGCEANNINEHDAAKFNGKDDMESLTGNLHYRGFGESSNKMIILDECFSPETPVVTPHGLRAIGSLCVGDEVIGIKGVGRIKRVIRNNVPLSRIIKVALDCKKSILCSEDHLFLTTSGWIKAKDLNNGSQVLTIQASVLPLLQEVWDCIYELRCRSKILRRLLLERMSSLRENFLGNIKALFEKMWECCCCFKEVLPETGFLEKSLSRRIEKIQDGKTRTLGEGSQGFWRPHQGLESGKKGSSSEKEFSYKGGQGNTSCLAGEAWGEWSGGNKGTGFVAFISWWVLGICNLYWKITWKRWVAFQLQGRSWFSRSSFMCRGGWKKSFDSKFKEKGFNQGCSFTGIRVDRPSIDELRDIESSGEVSTPSTCYAQFIDLEIDGHPSYNVDGAVVHNCHALSSAAWKSLLKDVEEPAPHVFFVFCTTDPGKVPETIKTRCVCYNLRPLRYDDIMDLLEYVAGEETLKTSDDILKMVARACNGSPRQALVQLAMVMNCETKAEAASLLEQPLENTEIIDLCRKMLDRDLTWKDAVSILGAMPETSPESIRIVITTYISSCLMKPKSEKDVPRLLDVLAAFSKPCNPTDKHGPILLALGNCIFPPE